MTRHCSYCGSPYHNIRTCDSSNIYLIALNMDAKYTNYTYQFNNNTNLIKRYFVSWLQNIYTLVDLKVVAIRMFNTSSSRLNKYEYAIIICDKFSYSQINNIPNQNINPSVTEQNTFLQQPTEQNEDQNMLSWYIDTTPSQPIISALTRIRYPIGLTQQQYSIITPSSPRSPPPSLIRQTPSSPPPLIRQNAIYPYYNYLSEPQNIVDLMIAELDDELTNHNEMNKFNIKPLLVKDNMTECECPICYELTKCSDCVKLNCGHDFCGNCVEQILKTHNNMYQSPCCALCRTTISNVEVCCENMLGNIQQYCNEIN
jgi:hypothetical protein